MVFLKPLAGAAAIAAMMPLRAYETARFVTVPQSDEWRATHDPPQCLSNADAHRSTRARAGRHLPGSSRADRTPAVTPKRLTGEPRTPTATIRPVAMVNRSVPDEPPVAVGRGDRHHPETPQRRHDDRDNHHGRRRITTMVVYSLPSAETVEPLYS
jgi:hypothetical protein